MRRGPSWANREGEVLGPSQVVELKSASRAKRAGSTVASASPTRLDRALLARRRSQQLNPLRSMLALSVTSNLDSSESGILSHRISRTKCGAARPRRIEKERDSDHLMWLSSKARLEREGGEREQRAPSLLHRPRDSIERFSRVGESTAKPSE